MIVWFNLPISIVWLIELAVSQRVSPALLAVTVHKPEATNVMVPFAKEHAEPEPEVSAMVGVRPDVAIAVGV